MNVKDLKRQSQTDWTKLDTMSDGEISTSDIQPLEESYFAEAKVRLPHGKVSVVLSLDEETNDWYQSQGTDSRELMSVAIRIYAEAHKEIRR